MIAVAQFAALCCLSLAYYTGAERLTQHHGYQHASPTDSHRVPPTYYIPAQPSYTPPLVTHSRPQLKHSQTEPSYSSSVNNMPMPFGYGYGVSDQNRGIDFGHNTNSDGKVTTGEYRVLLPDGRTQIVTYTVDDNNGYQADVNYEGDIHSHKDSYTNEQISNTYGGAQISYGQPKPLNEKTQPSSGHKLVSEQIKPSNGQPSLDTSKHSHATVTSRLTPTIHKLQEATYVEPKSSKQQDTLFRSNF